MLNNTKILIFSLKIYPFIRKNNKEKYIKEIYEHYLVNDKIYKSFINYFKHNWENSEFLSFDTLPNGTIYNRTNNYVEAFHHKINNIIEYSHPKLSVLIDKLKILSKHYYQRYLKKLFLKG